MPQFRIYTRTEDGDIAGVNDTAPSALSALADRRFAQVRRPESRRSFAAEPLPDPCPTGDYAFNAERVKLILADRRRRAHFRTDLRCAGGCNSRPATARAGRAGGSPQQDALRREPRVGGNPHRVPRTLLKGDRMALAVKVTITTEDNEVLDQFMVEKGPNSNALSVIGLADEVRETLEFEFEVEDPSS
jgi:hypothetical protein